MVWRNSTATDQTDGRTAEPRQHHARKHWPDGEQQGALKLQAQASSATQALWIAVPKNHAVTHATE